MGRTNRPDRDSGRSSRNSRDRGHGGRDHQEVHGRYESGGGPSNGNSNARSGGDRQDRPRETRQWDHEDTIEEGNVRLTVTSSVFHGGRVRSYDFSRIFCGRPSRFFREEDLEDLISICDGILDKRSAEKS